MLERIARDVFMGSDDARNLLIFRSDEPGKVNAPIERRKFNHLRLTRANQDANKARHRHRPVVILV